MKSLSSAVLLLVALAFVACAPAAEEVVVEEPDTTEADVAAIEGLPDELERATLAGDAEAFVALFADDVMFMAPDAPAIVGIEAFRSGIETSFAEIRTDVIDMVSEETEVAGDWAYNRGTLTFNVVGGGESIQMDWKYLAIMRRQADGSWKYARFIHNSNTPPPDQ